MIMTVYIFVAGMVVGMFGAACLIVGIRRKEYGLLVMAVLPLTLGSLLVPNAHAIALAIHGGTP